MLIHETDLPVEKVYFWTDSTLTLQYKRNTTQRLKAYVANRKTEINEATDPNDWRHIPGELNPADLLTRGVTNPAQLIECNAHGTSYLGGPALLSNDEDSWPSTVIDQLDSQDPEIRKKSVLVGLGHVREKESGITIDPERFSSWTKMTRVAGWVRR